MTVLLVALGAAVGSAVRLVVSRTVPGRRGTLAVNVVGSLLLGLLADRLDDGPALALLGAGVCGGLTTFSTFAVEVVERPSAGWVALTAGGCLLACASGLAVAPHLGG